MNTKDLEFFKKKLEKEKIDTQNALQNVSKQLEENKAKIGERSGELKERKGTLENLKKELAEAENKITEMIHETEKTMKIT